MLSLVVALYYYALQVLNGVDPNVALVDSSNILFYWGLWTSVASAIFVTLIGLVLSIGGLVAKDDDLGGYGIKCLIGNMFLTLYNIGYILGTWLICKAVHLAPVFDIPSLVVGIALVLGTTYLNISYGKELFKTEKKG